MDLYVKATYILLVVDFLDWERGSQWFLQNYE